MSSSLVSVYFYIIHQITPSLHNRPVNQLLDLQFHNSQKTVVHSGQGLAPRIIVNTFIYILRILNKKTNFDALIDSERNSPTPKCVNKKSKSNLSCNQQGGAWLFINQYHLYISTWFIISSSRFMGMFLDRWKFDRAG